MTWAGLATLFALIVVTVTLIIVTSNDWRAEMVPLMLFGMIVAIAYEQEIALLLSCGRHARQRRRARLRAGRSSRDAGGDGRRHPAVGPGPQPQQVVVGRLFGGRRGGAHDDRRRCARRHADCCSL